MCINDKQTALILYCLKTYRNYTDDVFDVQPQKEAKTIVAESSVQIIKNKRCSGFLKIDQNKNKNNKANGQFEREGESEVKFYGGECASWKVIE